MTEYVFDLRSFQSVLLKQPGLSPARALAHAARAERNLALLEDQMDSHRVDELGGSDVVTFRVRMPFHALVDVSP